VYYPAAGQTAEEILAQLDEAARDLDSPTPNIRTTSTGRYCMSTPSVPP
jgi:hypothetical protein